jgi:UDP-N-acetylglucosamine transferase subunit ALG13
MIFISLGTISQPFPRMINLALFLEENLPKNQKIVVQHGHSSIFIHSQRIVTVPFLPFSKVQDYMSKSSFIICHGGPATIFQALSHHKVPYVLPRLSQFNEHVNDHQLYFCTFMQKKGLVKLIDSPDQLLQDIQQKHTVRFLEKKSSLNITKINQKLTRLVEKIVDKDQ